MPTKQHHSDEPRTRHQAQAEKQHVKRQERPSLTPSIAEAIIIKDADIFFLSEPNGRVPLDRPHGLGLYYHDTRFLNGYELKVADIDWDVLSASAARCFESMFQLSNPPLHTKNGHFVQKEELGLKWERVVNGVKNTLHDMITIQNYSDVPVELPLTATFETNFEPIFEVRGLHGKHLGHMRSPTWKNDVLSFIYDGADKVYRSLTVSFAPPPLTHGTTATFNLHIKPGDKAEIRITLQVAESTNLADVEPDSPPPPDPAAVATDLHRASTDWLSAVPDIQSGSVLLDRILSRSLQDLRMLRGTMHGKHYYGAGTPWFAALFGRDSLITCLQTLAFAPDMAADTLRLLAGFQGTKLDPWRDEQPGKIMHELRVGELAHLNEIPQTPYYGSVDSTPLFLILLGRHAAWTGSLDLFNELRATVELALDWLDDYADSDHDGFTDYTEASSKGLGNQGWKDSGNAIVNADGSLAEPPIALVEVQGYVYMAKREIAGLFERAGEADRAKELRKQADELKRHFNRAFWSKDLDSYVLALQADHRPCEVITSNPGQALWTGIVDRHKAKAVCKALLSDAMFSGWGVRTLAATAKAYNPIGYHVGAVWPHDNSLIAAGLRRYGFDDAFHRIFGGIADAASYFGLHRLPEVFCGFDQATYGMPVHYPIACHPQAWAAGTIPFLLTEGLGLQPDAFKQQLHIVRPQLPHNVAYLKLCRLRIGQAAADLYFARGPNDSITVDVINQIGKLDVIVED